MSEFAPAGRTPRMTKSQMRKYLREMEEKRKKAQMELDKMKLQDELSGEDDELQELDKLIDEM